ncbi:MAG: alpha-L-fucosidase [Provencibacterium sp.]|jgi:alpha-L-fucosidase|nr:alpha-L-fucosidase [Provencibacterium sp.]
MEQFADRRYPSDEERLKWFREAKFGMFIHWGIYAQLAGSWKGREIPGIGEQIMRFGKIPVEEYRQIAKDFNPVKFDAGEWVRIAKQAGMRYIVITAKHHDGFAMYHSHCSPYNIVDATPYGRDPMKDLAAACKEQGVRLCFYYSHYQDWDDPDGVVKAPSWEGAWPEEGKVFEKYMNDKALPQLTELLTQYGPVGILWFDTPGELSHYNARRFNDLVHAIQPECIVGPRISNDELGDYIGYGDNQVPASGNPLPWETCATMNDTWGFKAQDHNWKSPAQLIRLLCSIVGKGGNYLLNVGPTAEGQIPPESVERLHAAGEWLDRNGEAIYNARGCVLQNEAEWGAVTEDGAGCLYLHLFDWPQDGRFILNGLQNRVRSARLLATGEAVPFRQESAPAGDGTVERLTLSLPAGAPDPYVSVIRLEIEGKATFDETPSDCAGRVTLSAASGTLSAEAGKPAFAVSKAGILEGWSRTEDFISWKLRIQEPGCYNVTMNTFTEKYPEEQKNGMDWEGGHRFRLSCAGKELDFTVTDDGRSHPRDLFLWQNVATHCGALCFEHPGSYTLSLKPQQLCFEKGLGPKLKSLVLSRK